MASSNLPSAFSIRPAIATDAAVVAHHRARMFLDMGSVTEERFPDLERAALRYYERAIPGGEYVGFLAHAEATPGQVIGGAGVLVRWTPPFPVRHAELPGGRECLVARGKQGLVQNVFTEPQWRRRGVAQQLMTSIIAWAGSAEIDSLVLHASRDGRALYEQLGFQQTNEMRFVRPLYQMP